MSPEKSSRALIAADTGPADPVGHMRTYVGEWNRIPHARCRGRGCTLCKGRRYVYHSPNGAIALYPGSRFVGFKKR